MRDNIIIDIFNRSFKENPPFSINLVEKRIVELKIDNQDLALIETLSEDELDEMVHKIRDENKKLVEELSKQQSNKNELEVQLLDNFFPGYGDNWMIIFGRILISLVFFPKGKLLNIFNKRNSN